MSSSSEDDPAGSFRARLPHAGSLTYDIALPYAAGADRLLLPRLRIDLQFFAAQTVPTPIVALLDTGAEFSAFDGALFEQAGWSSEEIARRALDVRPSPGVAPGVAWPDRNDQRQP